MSFDLSSIASASAEWKPQKIVLYSVQGLGKNTFASTFNKPIILPTEDGGGAIDVPTFPMLKSITDVEAAINTLHGEHDFKTVILDTADWLEPIVWAQTCAIHGQESIEAFGYGKGYIEADSSWRFVMGGLDSLRLTKGMTIIVLAHAEVKNYHSPEVDPYDRYQIKLHKRAFGLWQEWADMVLFANYKTHIEKSEAGFNKEVKRGAGSGERVIYTEERPAYLAKNRWGLAPEIYIGQDKTWSAFHKALSEATGGRYELPPSPQQ
jgi:AAA domain